MKYLKIFEDFERSVYTKISTKILNRCSEYLQEKYPFLNVDLYEDVDVIPGGDFFHKDSVYDSIESLIEGIHEYTLSIWNYKKFNYAINDGVIDMLQGYVDLSNKKLYRIPYKFGNVSGDFQCNLNNLTTLYGAPHTVGGGFWCGKNRLTTLEGGPQTVGGRFECHLNNLTTLKGSPKYVGQDFKCNHNQLITLEGAPHTIGRDFFCNHNQLTNLKHLPEKVGGRIYCWDNQNLTDISDVPEELVSKIRGIGK